MFFWMLYIIEFQYIANLFYNLVILFVLSWIQFVNPDFKIKFVQNSYYGSAVFR